MATFNQTLKIKHGQVIDSIGKTCKNNATQTPTIIAASKTQNTAEIQGLIDLGINNFGENYVQEALSKKKIFEKTKLHLIGNLQTNKAKQAAELFDVIHTVHKNKLATALEKACVQLNKEITIFIQVNIANEPQKQGVSEEGLDDLVKHVQNNCPHLKLIGLMMIPPAGEPPTPYFRKLKKLAEAYNLKNLSMGMSNNYQEAIKEGATHIRIGSAFFGERKT